MEATPASSKKRRATDTPEPRRRPVSCAFCRKKKLRCSRTFPCGNCSSRNIPCDNGLVSPAYTEQSTSPPSVSEQPDLEKRLKRLEGLIAQSGLHPSPEEPDGAATTELRSQDGAHQSQKHISEAADWLEGTFLRQSISDNVLSDGIVFRVCPAWQTSEQFLKGPYDKLVSSGGQLTKCIWLPNEDEFRDILDTYVEFIHPFFSVVHMPSFRCFAAQAYATLAQGTTISSNDASLLLSIVASTKCYFVMQSYGSAYLYSGSGSDERQVNVWVKATLDALDHCQRAAKISFEIIQATIILTTTLSFLEGISDRFRRMVLGAIVLAQELSLHLIDSPNKRGGDAAMQQSSVRRETGRRVWWHLALTTWILGQYSGLQHGMINPDHMAVNKPLNINDEDLVEGACPEEAPLDHPTSSSYLCQKIRLGEVCYKLSSRIPFSGNGTLDVDYSYVLKVDSHLENFFEELPLYYRADTVDLGDLGAGRLRAYTTAQRHALNVLVHTHRCRIHLPFMVQRKVESQYAYSRRVCLDSARMVIQSEKQLWTDPLSLVYIRAKCAGVTQGVFTACVAFAVDLCLNGENMRNHHRRKAEVAGAIKLLYETSVQTRKEVTTRMISSIDQLLKRYNISMPPEALEYATGASSDKAECCLAKPGDEFGHDVASTAMHGPGGSPTPRSKPMRPEWWPLDDMWPLLEGGTGDAENPYRDEFCMGMFP